jgi:hypothetical protein
MQLIPDIGKSNEERSAMFAQLRALISQNKATLQASGGNNLSSVFGGN